MAFFKDGLKVRVREASLFFPFPMLVFSLAAALFVFISLFDSRLCNQPQRKTGKLGIQWKTHGYITKWLKAWFFVLTPHMMEIRKELFCCSVWYPPWCIVLSPSIHKLYPGFCFFIYTRYCIHNFLVYMHFRFKHLQLSSRGFHYLPDLKGHFYFNWIGIINFMLKYTSF